MNTIGADHLITSREPSLIGEATATFSPCRTWRYALTRRWDNRGDIATFIMLNPSTADAFVADPTIRRCQSFAKGWGYGGLLVLNCFALRSTDPRGLLGHTDPVGPDNDTVITSRLGQMSGPVVAAWGVHATYRGRSAEVAELVRAAGRPLLCLGVTKGGHPRHPLYVAGSTELSEWPGGCRG